MNDPLMYEWTSQRYVYSPAAKVTVKSNVPSPVTGVTAPVPKRLKLCTLELSTTRSE